jgi:hypothetical protein
MPGLTSTNTPSCAGRPATSDGSSTSTDMLACVAAAAISPRRRSDGPRCGYATSRSICSPARAATSAITAASRVVAHLNWRTPARSSSRQTSGILVVFRCGRQRSTLPQ